MRHWTLVFILLAFTSTAVAQSHDKQVRAQVDSALTARYYQNKGDIDSTYITRPKTKWTVRARWNVSGAKIEAEGIDYGNHFKSEMMADYKSTLSLAVSY